MKNLNINSINNQNDNINIQSNQLKKSPKKVKGRRSMAVKNEVGFLSKNPLKKKVIFI